MKKLLFIIAVAVFLIVPFTVSADICSDCPKSEEGINEWLESKFTFKQNGDTKYIELPLIELPKAESSFDADTLSEAIIEYIFKSKSESISINNIDFENKIVSFGFPYMTVVAQQNMPMVGDIIGPGQEEPEPDPNAPLIMMKHEDREYHFELVSDYDQTVLSTATSIVDELDSSYSITDLATINLSWNYGIADVVSTYHSNNQMVVNDPQLFLYSYQAIKNSIRNNMDYDFDIKVLGNYSSLVESGIQLELLIKKDGVIYASKVMNLSTNYYFFVDKDDEGTVEERVRARLENYLGDDVDFYIKPYDTYETYMDGTTSIPLHGFYLYFGKDSEEIHTFYEWFCNHDEDYCIDTPFTMVSSLHNMVGDMMKRPYYTLLVAEVDGSKVRDLEVSAVDGNTGVEIETGSYEVPLDTLINSEDLKNAQNIISVLNKYNYTMIDAYNIEIYGYGNGNKIKQISNGVVVFIPIKGYKEGDVITIRHITDDNELGDTYQGTVVKKNGKLYAKFTTTHFSTYAIVTDATTNPPTGDEIIKYSLLLIISVLGTFGTLIHFKKNRD